MEDGFRTSSTAHRAIRSGFALAAIAAILIVAPAVAEAQHYGLINVAQGRPVTAVTGNYIGLPQYATDGKADTYWFSHYTQEYTIDLGRAIPLGKIVVFTMQASGATISSSLDGTTFTPRHTFNATDAQHSNWVGGMVYGPLTFAIDGTYSARYLKYQSVNLGCGCYQGTGEFAVYEWVATPPPALSGGNLAARAGTIVTGVLASAVGFPPPYVADGDLFTLWKGAHAGWYTGMAGQQWGYVFGRAKIDLGAEFLVFGARVRRPAEGGAQTVSVSFYSGADQEIAWVGQGDPAVVGTLNLATGDVEFVLDTPVQARYIRIYQMNPLVPNLAIQPALAEVEVFGNAEQSDTTPPVLTGLPAYMTAEATGPSGAIASWPAPFAIDDLDGAVTSACSPASGSSFPVGTTTVTCTATDRAGNTASGSFTVMVSDTTPPAISVPADIAADATGSTGAVVNYTASAVDAVDGAVTPACSPASGSIFPVGTTTVTCTAIDSAGNRQVATFNITITGAWDQISLLGALLSSFNLQPGLANSMGAKLRNAEAAITRGDITAACGQLGAFINQASAQSGQALTAAQALQLQASASGIRRLLGC